MKPVSIIFAVGIATTLILYAKEEHKQDSYCPYTWFQPVTRVAPPQDIPQKPSHNHGGPCSPLEQCTYPAYSAQEINAYMCSGWSTADFAHAMAYASMRQGRSQHDLEHQLLEYYEFYRIPAFRKYIKTFSGYRAHVKELYASLVAKKGKYYRFCRKMGFLNPRYVQLLDITEKMHTEIIEQEKAEQEAAQQRQQQAKLKAEQELHNKQESLRFVFDQQREALPQLCDEWTQLQDIYQEYGLHDDGHYERRKQAVDAIIQSGCTYETRSYTLSPHTAQCIQSMGVDRAAYQSCYGNQLQQAIHQECMEGIDRLASLSETSVIYPHKEALAVCFDAAREYNQAGAVDKATAITDFCWALLDYGKAIAEGAMSGVLGAVEDLLEHPGQAVMCAVAGEYMLAYQLSKILYNVANISITYAFDAEGGKQKWDEYVAPITQLIDAISNKEISLRDGLKGATQFAVQWKAQGKLLKGINKFCKTAKAKALEFAKNNPSAVPEHYMTTPEGIVFKNVYHGARDNKNLANNSRTNVKEKLEWTNHGFKHVPPKNLSWKEVIQATKNGRAFYKPGINIKELELYAWHNGTPTIRGKNWKVFKAEEIIGANQGKETFFMRVECSANTIHGHPILESEYLEYLK